jgi:hypothetical protein
MAKKSSKPGPNKVNMKTEGKTTALVTTYGKNYKGPQPNKSRTGKPAPAFKKGGTLKKKK